MIKKIVLGVIVFFSSLTIAQTTVTGIVNDGSVNGPLPGANIKVSRKAVGTTTDFDGKFTLQVSDTPPFTIEISSLGYETQKIEITKNKQSVTITLKENATSLDEVVISASRTPERVLESPVSIERMDARAIKNTSSPSFFDGLENLKGIDINAGGLTLKTVNTRGFATFGNVRFMQLVDGMDNSSPALNFAIGNLLGMSDLDVKTVEILPGASSALYGANAFNGIMFMVSKNPFDHQGISAYSKTGVLSQEASGNNPFYDLGIRAAHAFSDAFAAKVTVSYLRGEEWHATDYRNIDPNKDGFIAGDRSLPSYDGLNVYGDDFTVPLNFEEIALANSVPAPIAAAMGSASVSRTGYRDVDLMNYDAKSLKLNGSLHYRPWKNDRLEIIWNSKYGQGNTIYQGQNRFNIRDFSLQQHKLEFRGKNFFVRGYLTAEDAGDSFDTRFAAINLNNSWKSNGNWFTEYATGFIGAFTGQIPGVPAGNKDIAHQIARQTADTGRLEPGTPEFEDALNKIASNPDLTNGAKFQDNTKLYHVDANLNLRDYINWAEVQVGGSFRNYQLNSSGTIFTDADGPIGYDEYGIYTQIQKKLADERLKITASARYDKAKNFDGNVSPRLSLAYAAGEKKNHNFRASYQTGFRNPTTQNQYIGLDAGVGLLVGTAPDNLDRYVSKPIDLKIDNDPNGEALKNLINATTTNNLGAVTTVTGRQAYENSWTLSSIQNFLANGANNPALLEKSNVDLVKPEKVTAYEVGYRAAIKKWSVDISGYYNQYEDFIASETVIAPLYGNINLLSTNPNNVVTIPGRGVTPISLVALGSEDFKAFVFDTNSAADVSSYGAVIGVDTKINGFNLGASYSWSKFDFDQASDPDFEAGFNTPEHKVKFQFGHPEVIRNLGFNINVRWQDAFLWESSFHDAMVDARTVLDAQLSYKLPFYKSVLKFGGTNLTGNEYYSAPGIGKIGSQYYVSLTVNN